MAGSVFGNIFKISTWGESHGEGLGVVIDGCPAGLPLCEEDIQEQLDRRKPGQSKFTTPRKEDDEVHILSGVFEGKTTGTPISLAVYNKTQRSADYSEIANYYRPGHADYTFDEKFGFRDYRGGGTFDVSVIDIGDNVIEVLATSGDNHLGGDDFDERIVNYLVEQFKISDGINLSKDASAMQRLREEAEKAKKELSSSVTTNINLPFIAMAKDGPHHIDITLSRHTFNELTADLVDRTITPVENALHDAGLSKTDINMVLLVGGSTRIPAVADKVRQLMGKEPSRNLNPDECVALGAAVQGGKLGNQLQAGSAASEIILMDVTPMSLSIETMGGIASRLIERNTTIPTRHSQIFTTAGNFQTSVDIKVFQGERKFTRDNKLLGNFRLNGIKRAMAGVPQIEVTFDIDVNGIVNVSAKDLGTGREQSITITSSSNMTEEEIEKARWEAEIYSKQDEAYQSFIDIREDAVRTLNEANNALAANKKVWEKDKKKNVKTQIGHLGKLISKAPIDKLDEERAASLHEAAEAVREALR
jgi:molecular chaperone DnaK